MRQLLAAALAALSFAGPRAERVPLAQSMARYLR